jgi:hypothetical protein
MSSWRDGVSAPAQAELDRLLDTSLALAQAQLAKAHEFDPFAVFAHDDGRVLGIELDTTGLGKHPDSVAVMNAALAQLRNLKGQARCTALTTNTRLSKEKTDALEISLEHRDGASLTVLLPYKRAKFGSVVEYGQLRAFAAAPRVWK